MANHDPAWHRELVDGSGRAAQLDPALRSMLEVATAGRATEQADQARAVARAEKRQRDAEQRQRLEAERSQRRAAAGRRVRDAFSSFWGRLIAGAVLVGLTPVAASFVTIMPFGGPLERVVFFPGETGSVAGSGPFTLYAILAWSTGLALVALLIIDLTAGRPRNETAWGGVLGAILGLGAFILQWTEDSLTAGSWVFAPALMVVGYALHVLIDRLRGATSGGVR